MSSAALQSAPHQQTALSALNTHSSSSSPANRQYTPAQSLNREGHYANRDRPSTSPGSLSKRPSRRPSENSANGANIGAYLEQPQSTMSSRTTLASPAPVMAASTEYERPPSNRRRADAPVAPPRTSSTQHGHSASQSSRRTGRTEDHQSAAPPKRTPAENGRVNTNGYSDPNHVVYEESNSRAKRAASQHVPSETYTADSSRDHRQTVSSVPVRTRDQQASSASAKQPSHEPSEVLNRVIVSQPEVDLEREQQRQGEAQPHSASAHGYGQDENDDAAAPPPVTRTQDAQDESRRGGRSRHDHSKREKSSRFGDYYLGNTIGEGEFGKVKLGWKQDGGVQVKKKSLNHSVTGRARA